MSTQLRGRRSGPLWSLLLFFSITALVIGYCAGNQRLGVLLPLWTPTSTGASVALITTVAPPTVTSDPGAVQTVVAVQLATVMAATSAAQPSATPTPTNAPDLAATQTASAVSAATAEAATVTAQPTATDTVAPTPGWTATAVATPTPLATSLVDLRVFGPENGSLIHIENDQVKSDLADVYLRDFVTEAVFTNPYTVTQGIWDIGFRFRVQGQNEFRLIIQSDSKWFFGDLSGNQWKTLQQGKLFTLNVSDDGQNWIKLIAQNDHGFFFLNGIFVSELDLSVRKDPGSISIATGMANGHEIAGAVTDYYDFSIWELQPVVGPNNGNLLHTEDGFIEGSRANVNLQNFIVEATFGVPYSTLQGPWDIGFLFRHEGTTEQLRLHIDSKANWQLSDQHGAEQNIIAEGHISNLNISVGSQYLDQKLGKEQNLL